MPAGSGRRTQSRSPFRSCCGRLLPTCRPTVSARCPPPSGSCGAGLGGVALAPVPALTRMGAQDARKGLGEPTRCPRALRLTSPGHPQLSPLRGFSGGQPTPRLSGKCSTSTTWVSGPQGYAEPRNRVCVGACVCECACVTVCGFCGIWYDYTGLTPACLSQTCFLLDEVSGGRRGIAVVRVQGPHPADGLALCPCLVGGGAVAKGAARIGCRPPGPAQLLCTAPRPPLSRAAGGLPAVQRVAPARSHPQDLPPGAPRAPAHL